MPKTKFISAICTPLRADETLHVDGLAAHIEDQFENGISGVLVAGTMGKLQLLTDGTYLELVKQSVRLAGGRGEVLVGVGDMGFARTRERIKAVETRICLRNSFECPSRQNLKTLG